MSDQNIDIRINTQANTAGAKLATASVQELENKVESLEQELRNVPVGGDDFVRLSGQIKATKTELEGAEVAARKLGVTTSRNGNLGLGFLEISRLAEDAQYGIRGILNNIPQAVLLFGGSAGLAGGISLAAVAASQLWERLGNGAINTEDDVQKAIDRAKELRDMFLEAGRAASMRRENAASQEADRIDRINRERDRIVQRSQGQVGLQEARLDAERRVTLADEAYKLAQLEMGVLTRGQREGLSVAQQRLSIEQETEKILQRNAEALRQLRENTASQSVQRAESRIPAARQALTNQGNELEALQKRLADAVKAQAEQAERYTAAQKELEAATKDLEQKQQEAAKATTMGITGPETPYLNVQAVQAAEERFRQAQRNVSQEKEILPISDAQIAALREQVKSQTEIYKESAQNLVELRSAAKDAAQALADIRANNDIQRTTEAAESTRRNTIKEAQTSNDDAVSSVRGIIDQVKAQGGASKELQAVVAEAEQAIADGMLSAAELERLPGLFSQFSGQMQRLGQGVSAVENAVRYMDELNRRLRALEIRQQ